MNQELQGLDACDVVTHRTQNMIHVITVSCLSIGATCSGSIAYTETLSSYNYYPQPKRRETTSMNPANDPLIDNMLTYTTWMNSSYEALCSSPFNVFRTQINKSPNSHLANLKTQSINLDIIPTAT